jgi:glucan phosphoethanolaminetransferase (alkaline phosphatase superfamily)
MNENELNFQPLGVDLPKFKRRRNMLPWWVIGSIWLFLVFSAVMPVAIVFGLLGYNFEISLLGLTTHDPFSIAGIVLMLLFAFKGIIAFGLWTEKKWAVGVAKIDAIISIVICCSVMAYSMFALHQFSLRLELIVLVPYFYKMNSIQYDWLYFDDTALIPASTDVS